MCAPRTADAPSAAAQARFRRKDGCVYWQARADEPGRGEGAGGSSGRKGLGQRSQPKTDLLVAGPGRGLEAQEGGRTSGLKRWTEDEWIALVEGVTHATEAPLAMDRAVPRDPGAPARPQLNAHAAETSSSASPTRLGSICKVQAFAALAIGAGGFVIAVDQARTMTAPISSGSRRDGTRFVYDRAGSWWIARLPVRAGDRPAAL